MSDHSGHSGRKSTDSTGSDQSERNSSGANSPNIDSIRRYLAENKSVIAISGKSGCGNTTTSRYIAERLGLELVNYTFRSLATERSVSLEQIMKEAAKNDDIDRYIDKRQVELSQGAASVLASRLAIWLKDSAILKVYLHAERSVRIHRIMNREGWTEEKTLAHTLGRDTSDHDRYLRLYGIDNDVYDFADLVLDSGALSVAEIYAEVEKKLALKVRMAQGRSLGSMAQEAQSKGEGGRQ